MNKRISLTIAILALLIIGAGYFWIFPTLSMLAETRDSIHEEILAREQALQQQNDIVTLKQQFEKIKQDASELQGAFFSKDSDALVKTIDTLDAFCKKWQLEQTISISPLPQGSADPIAKSEITMTLHGDIQNLAKFLRDLENEESYYIFSSLQISASQSGDKMITADLKGHMYWQ